MVITNKSIYSKRILYSWQNFNDAMEVIVNRIRAERYLLHLERIYGLPRGGLVLAVKLSYRLGLPLATLEDVVAYGQTLVVNDISDSGESMRRIGKLAVCTATLHIVSEAAFVPDIWVEARDENAWVVYPWEV